MTRAAPHCSQVCGRVKTPWRIAVATRMFARWTARRRSGFSRSRTAAITTWRCCVYHWRTRSAWQGRQGRRGCENSVTVFAVWHMGQTLTSEVQPTCFANGRLLGLGWRWRGCGPPLDVLGQLLDRGRGRRWLGRSRSHVLHGRSRALDRRDSHGTWRWRHALAQAGGHDDLRAGQVALALDGAQQAVARLCEVDDRIAVGALVAQHLVKLLVGAEARRGGLERLALRPQARPEQGQELVLAVVQAQDHAGPHLVGVGFRYLVV